eukprot:244304_1
MSRLSNMLKIKIQSAEVIAPKRDSSSAKASPISPMTPVEEQSGYPDVEPYCVENVLKCKGYADCKRISEALQGDVYEAANSKNGSTNIIKVANKTLYKKQITCINGKRIKIQEDIVREASILRHLTQHNPPPSLTKYKHFFDDSQNFFLVMEHGGENLFDFVKECHQCIEYGLISNSVWLAFCKTAMQQMVDVVAWLQQMHCCHLDISLENFVIHNLEVRLASDQKTVVSISNFQIKIIDFGLAEVFGRTKSGKIDYNCNKYVGKKGYKAPKVLGKRQIFDARSADCWSLGVTFFMMCIGAPPFQSASPKDIGYQMVMKGQLMDVLYDWDRVHYVTFDILDLLCRIFVEEKYRLDIKGIQAHPSLL